MSNHHRIKRLPEAPRDATLGINSSGLREWMDFDELKHPEAYGLAADPQREPDDADYDACSEETLEDYYLGTEFEEARETRQADDRRVGSRRRHR